jgi:ApbE superfamily uncharacterized protein (UPF0280 family)
MSALARLLPDGRRLHLQHGPIDLVIEAWGRSRAIAAAYQRAAARFPMVLPELVDELAVLRRPLGARRPAVRGAIAQRMVAVCWPHRAVYITPMAAVAGAVADHMLGVLTAGGDLARATVNNGGDIALHLAPGERLTAGLVADVTQPALHGTLALDHATPVRGLATSGWRGRSVSRGIADAVTVLAVDAATADAAATMVANAVDVDHPVVCRAPASSLRDDSDLGDLPVTVAVGALPDDAIAQALVNGRHEAERLSALGLIHGAVLVLAGHTIVVSPQPAIQEHAA